MYADEAPRLTSLWDRVATRIIEIARRDVKDPKVIRILDQLGDGGDDGTELAMAQNVNHGTPPSVCKS